MVLNGARRLRPQARAGRGRRDWWPSLEEMARKACKGLPQYLDCQNIVIELFPILFKLISTSLFHNSKNWYGSHSRSI